MPGIVGLHADTAAEVARCCALHLHLHHYCQHAFLLLLLLLLLLICRSFTPRPSAPSSFPCCSLVFPTYTWQPALASAVLVQTHPAAAAAATAAGPSRGSQLAPPAPAAALLVVQSWRWLMVGAGWNLMTAAKEH